MQEAFELDMPLDVEMGLTDNWLDAHWPFTGGVV